MIRPTLGNLLMVTALAVAGLIGAKALVRYFPVPGLSDVINAA